MACKYCGDPNCQGDCEMDPFFVEEEVESTQVGIDRNVIIADIARLKQQEGLELDLDDADPLEIDIEVDELVEAGPTAEPPEDPFAALESLEELVMLDGTSDGATLPFAAPEVVTSYDCPQMEIAVVMGRFLVQRRFFDKCPLTIGRDGNLPLVLNNPSVSRRHCEIRKEDDKVVVVDLGSANGTFVNGERALQCALYRGSVIGVGKFYLIISPTPAQLAKLQAQSASAGRYSAGKLDD